MYRNRPLTPLGMVIAPIAFWLTHVVRPIFDTISPEPTKYKYRVGGAMADPLGELNKAIESGLAQDKHG